MKILDNITSIFNDKQRDQLEQLLNHKVGEGTIAWRDTFITQFRSRLEYILDGLKINTLPTLSEINMNWLNEQFENILITLASLMADSENIQDTISTHEMFRKDDVKTYFNMSRNFMDMINNEVRDYRANNISLLNGIIELIPTSIIDYPIRTVDVEYIPENMVKRLGNDPTPENLTPGTDKDYWLSEVITSRKSSVGARVTIGFNGIVNFNLLNIATAGKYPVTIESVEVPQGTGWKEVYYTGKQTEKFLELTMVDIDGKTRSYSSDFIRITVKQSKPDFIWEMGTSNEREILSYDTERLKSFLNYTYLDKFDLFEEQTLRNVYSYMFGLYYIRILFKMYDGDAIGNFYSRKFGVNEKFNYVEIESEEYKPSEENIIRYDIIQDDGNLANYEFTKSPVNIYKIDVDTNESMGEASTGLSSNHMITVGSYIWVANGSGGSISKIDKNTKEILETVKLEFSPWSGKTPYCLVYSAPYIYVTCSNSSDVYRIDISSTSVVDYCYLLDAKSIPRDIIDIGSYLYVADEGLNKIRCIKKADGTITSVDTSTGPVGLTYDGTYLWVTNSASNSISKFNLTDPTAPGLVATTRVGLNPRGITYFGGKIWVANYDSDKLMVVDKDTNVVLRTVDVGKWPMLFASDGTDLWVTNNLSGTVTRIDTSYNTESISVGQWPFGITYDSDGGIWVSHNIYLKPGDKVNLLDYVLETESITGVNGGNVIKLKHYPIVDSDFICRVNGMTAVSVNSFGESLYDFEVIVRDNLLFFNRALDVEDLVLVNYNHSTDYVIIKITMETNTVFDVVDCPKIKGFDVTLYR